MEELTPNQQPMPGQTGPAQTGKSSNPFKVWAVMLGILLLAAAGFAVWQTLQLNSQSAKVSELEATNSQLAESIIELTEPSGSTGNDSSSQNGDTPVSNSTDATKILAAVDAYERAPVAASSLTFEYSVEVNDDNFARVSVSPSEGSGHLLWLKKVDENWTVLVGGQEPPSQEIIEKYGLTEAVLE